MSWKVCQPSSAGWRLAGVAAAGVRNSSANTTSSGTAATRLSEISRPDRPASTLAAMTPNSLTSPSRLRSHLREVRERGVAYDECESNDAVNCAAAPVYDRGGAMVAAMSISVPTFRWNDQVRRDWSELVSGGAARLSQRLGHAPARRREPARPA